MNPDSETARGRTTRRNRSARSSFTSVSEIKVGITFNERQSVKGFVVGFQPDAYEGTVILQQMLCPDVHSK